MSLSDLASLGSFVSGVAVLISLIFLFFQMRQMTEQVRQAERNQQASIRQNRATQVVGIQMQATDPSVADAVSKGNWGDEDITITQLHQYQHYCRAIFLGAEDSFYQYSEGLLSESAFATYAGGLAAGLTYPGQRAMWKRNNRRSFPSPFVAFIDKLVAEGHVASEADRLARWKADIAVEKAQRETRPAS